MNAAPLIKKMNAALLPNYGLRLMPTRNSSGKGPHLLPNPKYFRLFNEGQTYSNLSVTATVKYSFLSSSGLLLRPTSGKWPHHFPNCCRLFNEGQTNSNLTVTPTVEDTQKSFSKLARPFAAFHSHLVSFPMRTEISPAPENQVFINYRGEQVGNNVVSHLCNELERRGIKYFIDKNEQRGKDLSSLYERIQESTIALVIFSTRYPESSWCMNELVEINKLAIPEKLIVIPIFYKVRARDIKTPRHDNEFGRNFWRLAEGSSGDEIKNWKEALESITQKMGLSFGEESSESEADFIKKIGKVVKSIPPPSNQITEVE